MTRSFRRCFLAPPCCGLGGDWDNCYIGVLVAIAAAPISRSQAPVGNWQPRQLQFGFVEPEL
jgi:hypothetical protein